MRISRLGRACVALTVFLAFFLGQVLVCSAEGILQVKSGDAGVEWQIEIDGQAQVYESGMELRLAAGSHTIRATAPGVEPIDRTFEIRDGVVKVFTLSSEASQLVETTDEEVLKATRKITRLVVVGKPSAVDFAVDEHSSRTPASFAIGVGQHDIVAGALSQRFDLLEDRVTYVKIDSAAGRIYGFNMTSAQETEIEASAASSEEVFDKGFKLYGGSKLGISRLVPSELIPAFLRDVRILAAIGLGLVLIAALCLRLRLSLRGKARYFIGRKRRLTRKIAGMPPGADQEKVRKLTQQLDRTIARRKRYEERLAAHIARLQVRAGAVPPGEKGAKLAARLKRRNGVATQAKDMLAAAEAPVPTKP